jgi:uncharacterized protein YggE
MSAKISLYSLSPNKNRLNIFLDSRKVIIFLILAIVAMLLIWKPWNKLPKSTDRTVQVTGEASVKATPDEFVFSPSYDFKNANKQAALDELSKKSDEIVAQLKKLGVADNQIKTNADGYERGIYFPSSEPGQTTYSLSINVTVDSKDLAQKVQDYLVSTSPAGAVTPYPTFSESKRKDLQSQAQSQAEKDARSKAGQSAKNIGFKLGAVKTVSEANGVGEIEPLMNGSTATTDLAAPTTKSAVGVQPGQSDINYQVSVTYYIK